MRAGANFCSYVVASHHEQGSKSEVESWTLNKGKVRRNKVIRRSSTAAKQVAMSDFEEEDEEFHTGSESGGSSYYSLEEEQQQQQEGVDTREAATGRWGLHRSVHAHTRTRTQC